MQTKTIDSLEGLNELIKVVKAAQAKFAQFTQEAVDRIFSAVALEISKHKIPLAKLAVNETGMGVLEDKIIKNQFAAEYIYNKYKTEKTCGVIERDPTHGYVKLAEPVGVIAGIIPTTNPTSTAIYKALLALKTRNALIVSPHPRAKQCTIETLKLIAKAATAAGAPDNLIGWIDNPTIELSQALMRHPDIALILATGGPAMVNAAYSSGNPAVGVGAGNVPVIIDATAKIDMAVSSIILSKTFDNGMICASEQSVTAVKEVYDAVKQAFIKYGCHILTKEEASKVGKTIIIDGRLNAAIVGQSAHAIAKLAGVKVPETTKVLLAEVEKTTLDEPFAHEKLSPILALYKASTFEEAIRKAEELVELGGPGHSASLFTDVMNHAHMDQFAAALKTCRLLINSPSAYGGIGDVFNFRLAPSLTLGCGSYGKNSVSENVGVKHLLNTKTVAERRDNMLWFKVPQKIYFKRGAVSFALKELQGHHKAVIITDKAIFELGYTKRITDVLEEIGVQYATFFEVLPDPTISMVNRILELCNAFQPDLIIAVGGGSPMDAAKLVQFMYEFPNSRFEDLAARFMDIRKRIYEYPTGYTKTKLVCIPTTSGTGSETTPFTIITDDTGKEHVKHSLADYLFTPYMAIVDPDLVLSMPKGLAVAAGYDVLAHATEAYVSTMASPFTDAIALQAIKIVFTHLPKSVSEGHFDDREQMHYAATLAGMAFSNAFLGICHSMAHKLGARFNIPHGLAIAYCYSQVIRFNATDKPTKQAAFPQYETPNAAERYAQIADYLGLGGNSIAEKVNLLIQAAQQLKQTIGIKLSLKEAGINEKDFMEAVNGDLPELAYDDQCTTANPRYPLISELRELYIKTYNGDTDFTL